MMRAIVSCWQMLGRGSRRLTDDRRGLGAVEFAMTAPFLILLYLGGFQMMDAISAYRKVTITARTLADLTTQSTSLTAVQADSILNGARQVMTPYSTTDASLSITEINIDDSGKPTVTWTRANDSTKITNADLDVPADIKVPDTNLIYAQIVYHYTPVAGGKLIGPLTFSDHIYMNPRRSDAIPCPDC